MKKTFQLFVLLIIICSCSKDDDVATIDTTLEDFLNETVEDNEIPGLIAAIIDSDGIREIAAAGVRKFDSPELLTIEDQIHLGSCTKAMTGTLMATLVRDDLLSWDSQIIEIFPEFETVIDESFHEVTLHQLVTNRGGIPTNASDWFMFEDLELMDRRVEFMKANLAEPSGINIGDYNYSNLGFMIAGAMAEKVTGNTWEQLMEERLFTPLGMTNSSFGVPGTTGMVDQPWGHYWQSNTWNPIQADNPEALGPAGTVHASFQDWTKFIQLQLPGGTQNLLSDEELDFLIDPVGTYAAGWNVVDRSWGNGTVFTHSGSNTIWFVTVWVAPELDRAYLVGTNSANDDTFTITDQVIGELIDFDQN